jgi:hypothetical protein
MKIIFDKYMPDINVDSINNSNVYKSIIMSIKTTYSDMIVWKTKREHKISWWSKELGDIKRSIFAIKKKFRFRRGLFKEKIEYNMELKELKAEFRREQRRIRRNKDKKMFDFIENIGKNRNKKQFWNKIRAYKQKELGGSVKIDIGLKLLGNHFKEVFGESKEEEFSIMDIKAAMNETNNSKAIGLNGISYC